jgi:hypothetical protein
MCGTLGTLSKRFWNGFVFKNALKSILERRYYFLLSLKQKTALYLYVKGVKIGK